MNLIPVSAILKDFSECPPDPVGISHAAFEEMSAPLIEAAREEGRQAGREEALAEAEAQIAEREAQFSAQLAAAREAWVASEGKVLAEHINKGFAGLHDAVLSQVAQVLKPFLVEEVRQKAIAELAIAVGGLLSKEPEVGLEIAGPADLIKCLEAKLLDHAGAVSTASADFCEVEVKAGSTVVSTRISAWLDRINEVCP